MLRKNNFDFLRLIFASFVIITHSYALTGLPENDLLAQATNGQMLFSWFGVKGFFIISGYLIFQSFERSANIIDYYWKRLLRLIPGLFIVLLVTLLLAPIVYQNAAVDYLHNRDVWTYLPRNILMYRPQYSIAGIFEDNVYKRKINGSLWTIAYEFTMYVLISCLFLLKRYRIAVTVTLTVAYILLLVGNFFLIDKIGKYSFYLSGDLLLDLGAFFLAGSMLALIKIDQVKILNWLIVASITVVVIGLYYNALMYVKFICLPIIIIGLGLKSTPYINNIGHKFGDLSYGIYIYAFPVQQTLMHYYKLNYMQLMGYSLVITYILAYFSWHFVESRALRLKKIKFGSALFDSSQKKQ